MQTYTDQLPAVLVKHEQLKLKYGTGSTIYQNHIADVSRLQFDLHEAQRKSRLAKAEYLAEYTKFRELEDRTALTLAARYSTYAHCYESQFRLYSLMFGPTATPIGRYSKKKGRRVVSKYDYLWNTF